MKKIGYLFFILVFLFSAATGFAGGIVWPTSENLSKNISEKKIQPSVYKRAYSLDENIIDKTILKRNTFALVGTSVAAMGLLYLMPSSFTNWEDDGEGPAEKWWNNVSREPVWDKDDFFLNYVTHPYSGAIYYMGARSAGANATYSFLYSFALSTFFWEYGIESFAERPSIQDLIVTPVAGALLGEGFYLAKRHILENNSELWGSKALGKIALFAMDPMTEITTALFDDSSDMVSFSSQPFVSSQNKFGYGLKMTINF